MILSNSWRRTALIVLFGFVCAGAQAVAQEQLGKYGGVIREVYPGDNFKAVMALMQPGDELVFHQGVYRHTDYKALYSYGTLLYLGKSGESGKPLVFRGYGEGEQRPVFIGDSSASNLCEVWGNHIEISYMEFQPISARGVRIVGGTAAAPRTNILVGNSVFRGSINNSIDANSGNSFYDGVRVLNNKFLAGLYTAVYIGAHDGSTTVTNFVMDGNYVDGSQVSNPNVVGYGIELKLNVKGAVVTNNLFVATKGPGIMVYGATGGNPADANTVEFNVVSGSRTDAGILAGAGPAIIRNNLVLACAAGGIRAYDYNSRGLLGNVTVTQNTAAADSSYGFKYSLPATYVPQNISFNNNIAISTSGVPGFLGMPIDATGNQEVASDIELENFIDALNRDVPNDPDSMDNVLPHFNKLKHGPFSLDEVKYLLDKVVQKLK